MIDGDVLKEMAKMTSGVGIEMQEAEYAINNWISSNPVEFSIVLSNIIGSDPDQITLTHINMAVILLQKIFSFNNINELRKYRNTWIDTWSGEQKENIRLAVIRTLLFTQESIVTGGAKLCATFFSFDLSEFHICERLATIMDPNKYSEDNARAALLCTAEICTNEWFDKEAKNVFIQESDSLMGIIGEMYHSITEIDITLGAELLRTLKVLVTSCPELFSKPEMLESIFSHASEILPMCESASLCELMFILLEGIIESLYDMDNFLELCDWNAVLELMIESFDFYEDPNLSINPMMFILQLTKFEGNRIIRGKKVSDLLSKIKEYNAQDSVTYSFPKIPICHNLIGPHSDSLFQIMINIAKNLPADDINFEDTDASDYVKIAFDVIDALHVVAPDVILSKCQMFIEENISDHQWQNRYIISVIPSLLTSEIHKISTYSYLTQEMPSILMSFIETDTGNMRLLGSSYQSIISIINSFNQNIDYETINRILENGFHYIPASPSIAQVVCSAVVAIIENKIDKGEVWEFRNQIFEIFDYINEKFGSDVPTITRGFRMICFLIKNSPDDVYEELSQIVIERVKSNITNSINTINTDQISPTILIDTLWLIHYLFNRYRMKTIPESEELAEFLLSTMKQADAEPFHEDILGPLMDILRCLNLESPEIPQEIVSYIPFAIESRSPTLVCTAIKAISVLYDCNPDMMIELCPNIVDNIGVLIGDETFPTREKVRLLDPLGTIIKSIHECFDPNLRDEIFASTSSIFTEMIAADPSIIDDEICLSELVTGVYSVFNGLVLATEPGDPGFFRSLNFKKLIGPIKVIANTGLLNNEALNALLDFFESAVSRFGGRGSLYLNAPQNLCIIAWCCLSRRASLARRAEELRKMMKHS